jgi:hypothetical protein
LCSNLILNSILPPKSSGKSSWFIKKEHEPVPEIQVWMVKNQTFLPIQSWWNTQNLKISEQHSHMYIKSIKCSLQNICYPQSIMGAVVLWSYGSWIYNYLCNQCLSPLKLWVRTPLMVRWKKLWQVAGFLRVLRLPPLIKLTAMM